MVLLLGLAGRLVRCSDYAQADHGNDWDVTRTKKDRAQGSGPLVRLRERWLLFALVSDLVTRHKAANGLVNG